MSYIRRMSNRLGRWWRGKLVDPNDHPDSYLVLPPYQDRPAPARYLEAFARFHKAHWQWLWPFAVTVALGIIEVFV